jgi:hypothetical protein
MTRTRPFLHSITHDQHGRRIEGQYLPLDAAERAADYAAHRGVAEGWPVRLTTCGQPAGEPLEVEFRRLVAEEVR